MKILNVNHTLDPVSGGGTTERTVQISRYLVRAGAECTVLTLDLGLGPETLERLLGVEVKALACLNRRFFIPKWPSGIINELVAAADVVHLMGHWTVLNALVYRACRSLNKPYVVCPAGALPLFGRSRMLKRIYNLVVGRRMVRDAARFIAITADEIKHYQLYGGKKERVGLIANGIAPDEYIDNDTEQFRQQHNLPVNNPIVLFLGRLNPIKGPDLLLDAFVNLCGDHEEYVLVFAGPDGGMQAELAERVRSVGIENRVYFIGFIAGADKSRALWAADLLVVPSRQEAMSIVALEAGITATPVLLTDQCGFGEVADVDGGVVVEASAAGLQSGLEAMLADRGRLKEMGHNLKKHVREKYLWSGVAEAYIRMYEEIGNSE